MTLAWNSAPGIVPSPYGVVKMSFRPSAVTPTTTMRSLNTAGSRCGGLTGQDLLLGEEQVLERIGREGRRAIGAHRRPAERHQAAPHRLRRAVVVGHHLLDPGHAGRARARSAVREADTCSGVIPRAASTAATGSDGTIAAGHLDKRHVAAGRTVGVVGEAGVADAAGGAGQRRERRGQQRPAFGEPGRPATAPAAPGCRRAAAGRSCWRRRALHSTPRRPGSRCRPGPPTGPARHHSRRRSRACRRCRRCRWPPR